EQVYRGFRVHGSGAIFGTHVPTGNLMRFGARDLVTDGDVDVTPRITADDATAAAESALSGHGPLRPRTTPDLRVLSTGDGTGRLVFSVELASGAEAFLVHVDAATGAVLRADDLVRPTNVSGNVKGRGQDFDPTTQPIALNLPEMLVRIIGGETRYTDQNGDFLIPNAGTTSVTVESLLPGRWVSVRNQAGPTDSITVNV